MHAYIRTVTGRTKICDESMHPQDRRHSSSCYCCLTTCQLVKSVRQSGNHHTAPNHHHHHRPQAHHHPDNTSQGAWGSYVHTICGELSAPVRSRPTTSQKIHPSRSSALLPPFIGLSIYLSILTNKSNLIDPSCVTRSSPIISNELGSSCRHYYPNMDASNYILT